MDRHKGPFGEVRGFLLPNSRSKHRKKATATVGPAPAEPTRTVVELFSFKSPVRRQAATPAAPVAPQALGWAWGPAPGLETGEKPGEPDGDAA